MTQKKSTLQLDDLKKLFIDFKINKLDALLLSSSEPLLYKNFHKVLEMAKSLISWINFYSPMELYLMIKIVK